jgi:uncharacterized cupin superfamily protein
VSEWFVQNVRDARWRQNELGLLCDFERHVEFPEFGINLKVIEPGQPMWMYHREFKQEDFLVLRGECVLIAEGEEIALRPWDFFHCPAGVAHVIIGAGSGPALVLAVGDRTGSDDVVYPVEPAARRHGAGVERETTQPDEAYAWTTRPAPEVPFREEFLTG